MTLYALITVDGTRLTDDSTCTIDGRTTPVPTRVDPGGRLAPLRIHAALTERGYRARDGRDQWSYGTNGLHIAVVPLDGDR